jgi:WD40 repeat protein
MSSVFVSHAARDAGIAAAVGARLTAAGFGPLFISSEPDHGIDAGRVWERELYEHLRAKQVVVFVGTPASIESRWCFAELALARSLEKPIFPVMIGGCGPHPLLTDVQALTYDPGEADPAARLVEAVRAAGFDPVASPSWDTARPPYPGLSSFTVADAGVFFGREAETEQVARRLQRRLLDEQPRCVVVLGASGSGKSSLIHAGVIPALQRQSERWLVLPPIVPGPRPLSSLAYALRSAASALNAPDELSDFEADPRALSQAVDDLARYAGLRPPRPGVLLVIDQMEELFTQAGDGERETFIGVVAEALADTESPLWVLASLRSEFAPRALADGRLVALLQRQMALGPMDTQRLRSVVRRPAEVAGLSFEPGLVERMLADARGDDVLPLLAFTLQKLHERLGARLQIRAEDYDAIGGVEGSLRAQADATMQELREEGVPTDEVIESLLALVLLGPEAEPVRHRVPIAELSPRRSNILDAFVNARLLTSATIDDQPAITVTHEALLRTWPPLANAIADDRNRLQARSHIERAARDWDETERSDAYLLTGDRLRHAVQWLAAEPSATALQRDFVRASERRDRASLERESELLADRVLAGFPEDPELAILLAVAALEEYAAPPRAIRALIAAMAESRVRQVLTPVDAITSLAWSTDGKRLAVCGPTGVAIWDVAAGDWRCRLERAGGSGVTWAPSGHRLAVACDDGTARIFDVTTRQELLVLRGHTAPLTCVAWAPDGDRLLTGSQDATARMWEEGAAVRTLAGHRSWIESVSWSPTGTHAVTASSDGSAFVWDVDAAEIVHELDVNPFMPGFEDPVFEAAWSPADGRIATAAADSHLRIWDLKDLESEAGRLRGHPGTWCVAWSPDGHELLSGGSDSTARIWSAWGRYDERAVLVGHGAGVSSVAWGPSDDLIASAAKDGTVRLWRRRPDDAELELRDDSRTYAVAWSPREARLLTTSTAGAVRLWKGEPLRSRTSWQVADADVNSPRARAAWSPDGSRVLTVGSGNAGVWDAERQELVRTLASDARVTDAIWSPDGLRIATAALDGTLQLYTEEGSGLTTIATGSRWETLRWSADGSSLVTTAGDRAVVWDVATGAQTRVWKSTDGRVQDAIPSPDSRHLVVVPYAAFAFVLDLTEQTDPVKLEGHRDLVYGAAWSPDGHVVATRSKDGSCRTWEPSTGALLGEVNHDGDVWVARWSPAGDRLLTSGADGTARIWDASSGGEIARLQHQEGSWVVRAVWSHDGRRVATSTHQQTLVWDATTGVPELIEKARRRVFRDLSGKERERFGLRAV